MKAAMLLAVIVGLTAFGVLVLDGRWWLGLVVGASAVLMVLMDQWRDRYMAMKRREAVLRRIVCNTFELGGGVVSVEVVARTLGTPDVLAAWDKQRADQEAIWVTRGGSER